MFIVRQLLERVIDQRMCVVPGPRPAFGAQRLGGDRIDTFLEWRQVSFSIQL